MAEFRVHDEAQTITRAEYYRERDKDRTVVYKPRPKKKGARR